MQQSETPRTIGAAERTCEILDILEECGEIRVSELADRIGLSPSTTYSYLISLVEGGYAVKKDHQYALSLRYISLNEKIIDRINVFPFVKDEVDKLASKFGERVQFGAEERGKVVCVYRATGVNAVRPSIKIGEYNDLYCIALGKAILAHMPQSYVLDIIKDHGLSQRTQNTIKGPDALFEELEDIRDCGYAIDDEECVPGVTCIAVPLLNEVSDKPYAISVSGPSKRMTDEYVVGELLNQLLQSKNIIEVNSMLTD